MAFERSARGSRTRGSSPRWLWMIALLALGSWCAVPAALAQEAGKPPAPKPAPEPPAPAPDPDDPEQIPDHERELLEGAPGDPASEIIELLDEIARNMKTIEDLLNRQQTGSETQGVQKEAVEQIDELIEVLEKSGLCGGSGASGGRPAAGSKPRPTGQQDQARSQQQKKLDEELRKQQEAAQRGKPNGAEKVPNDRTSEGRMPPARVGDLRPRDGGGRWGNLPGKVIEQIYDNGRRKLPEKYRILLEEYFRRLPQARRQ